MVNTKLLLFFVLALLAVEIIECKGGRGGGGRGGGRGRGHSSGGGGWFSGWGRSKPSTSHSYPKSPGYSGNGQGGSHTYPRSPGYSGNGYGGSHTYPRSPGYSGSSGGSRYMPSVPTYYTMPQHVYVTQYRNSDSRYSDLLTGLTMYNMGRSHGYYHNHYYSDDYYRRSANSAPVNTEEAPKEEATCFLRIKKDKKEDFLKIPCAIVSTFDNGDGAHEIKDYNVVSNKTSYNCSSVINTTLNNGLTVNNTNLNITVTETNLNTTANVNETLSNSTVLCGNSSVNVEDPLTAKGAPVDVDNMECSVEIRVKVKGQSELKVIRNNVDCKALLQQAKMRVPEYRKSDILPERRQLKAMLDKPPWWLALFIAV